MNQGLFIILVLISSISIVLGLFLVFKPSAAIRLQIKFYEMINWRIRPISERKEIRNTRIAGLLLIIIVLAITIYTLTKVS